MKRYLLLLAALALPVAATAQGVRTVDNANPSTSDQLTMIHNDLTVLSQQLAKPASGLDAMHFCYIAGQAYSVGAKLNDQVCVATGLRVTKEDGTESGDPLRWISAKQFAAGNY